MEPTGQARGTSTRIPSYAPGAEALRGAGAKASEGYPPVAKSAEAVILRFKISTDTAHTFIHGQSRWSSA